MESLILKGNAVSPGVALGPVYLFESAPCEEQEAYCEAGEIDNELARFKAALADAGGELDALAARCEDGEQGKIFAAHREILEDEEILDMVAEGITERGEAAAWAVYKAYDEFIGIVEKAPDPLIAARAADLKDVRGRLLRVLRGEQEKNLSALPGPCVVVAVDLLPSDTATLDRANVLGIITQEGGATSHTAIIANSYRIPAIVGVAGCTGLLPAGETVGVDALTGEVYLQPSTDITAALEEKRKSHLLKTALEDEYLNKPALMSDGTKYEIGVNIGDVCPPDTFAHCSFVGLFRTEFLYMKGSRLPDEQEQYEAYSAVAKSAGGRPVTLRTLDIGGDKSLPYMQLPQEQNPFLGLRALRLCFARPELLRTQLKAALRAAAHGPIWIMLPMVGSIEDIRAGKAALEAARAELDSEEKAYGQVKLGIMVEIPAIAAVADIAAQEANFASIGTNDLCQYLCAADRMNPSVSPYYQSFSPAMVRTLDTVISAFNRAGKPVSVCGELAGDPRGALLLCGLGLRKLSMDPSRIAGVKAALAGIGIEEAQRLADMAKNAATQADVLALLENALTKGSE